MHTRRFVLAAAAAPLSAPVAVLAAETATAKPPTVEEMLRPAVMLDADLSPNGEQVATLRLFPKDDKTFAYVRLFKAADPDAKPIDVVIGEYDAYQVQWKNDERLLVWIRIDKDQHGAPTGMMIEDTFYPIPVRRLLSMDLNGGNQVVLFHDKKSVLGQTFDLANVSDLMADDLRHILMQVWDETNGAYALYKVDVYTGGVEVMERGVPDTDSWSTQGGVPVLRFDSNSRGTVVTVMARAAGETKWKLFRRFRRNELNKLPEFDAVAATSEASELLVSTRPEDHDRVVIRKFNVSTLEFGDIVAETGDHDMEAAFTDMKATLVGCSYVDDRRNYVFADPEIGRHFRAVNKYFGNECNVDLYDASLDHNRFIFRVTGPRHDGEYHLYDRKAAKLSALGSARPWLSEDRLAKMEPIRVKTRDGAEIGAYLTTPINAPAGPLPMVVIPHGGPEVRDTLDYDLFAQTMAGRGWLVLQPNFRGSSGFGKAFADLGRKHWGDRMQEDVEDAAAQIIASGRADPKRVAIFGASYGGYSALMEAVRKPDLYKAVVAVAGDCSLIDTLAFSRHEDGADSPAYTYWLASIGDPKADEVALKAASPALRASEIKAPILLIHGTVDKIVDPKQSKIMAKALKAAGKTYEYVELKGEGHRDWSTDTWKTVLTRSSDFIAKYI